MSYFATAFGAPANQTHFGQAFSDAQNQPVASTPGDNSLDLSLRALDAILDADPSADLPPSANAQMAAIGDFPPAPPGYDPEAWGHGKTDYGRMVLTSPDRQRRYVLHPEDKTHWRHWDVHGPGGDKLGRWPENTKKPWSTQKAPPYGEQSADDPSGDEPGWKPPFEFFAPLLEDAAPPRSPRAPLFRMPGLVIP